MLDIVSMAFAGQHKHTTIGTLRKYFDIHQISSALFISFNNITFLVLQ